MKQANLKERQLVVQDILLSYYHIERSNSFLPAVVFLHGWGAEGRVWFQALESFVTEGFDMYCLDLPGFGKTAPPEEVWGIEEYSTAVREFIQKLTLPNVVLVGHSFGGQIAVHVAAHYPELVERLVLIAPAALRSEEKPTLKQRIASTLKPLFTPTFMKPARERILQKMTQKDYSDFPHMREIMKRILNEDQRRLLPYIEQQTLIMWGENDDAVPLETGKRIVSSMPHANLIVFPRAGHYAFLEDPKRFGSACVDFIEKKV